MEILLGVVVVLMIVAVLFWRQKRDLDEARRDVEATDRGWQDERGELLVVCDSLTAKIETLEARVKELDAENEKLDRENFRVHKENEIRREFAYVCRDCKQADPAVQAARERSLRAVTSDRKR